MVIGGQYFNATTRLHDMVHQVEVLGPRGSCEVTETQQTTVMRVDFVFCLSLSTCPDRPAALAAVRADGGPGGGHRVRVRRLPPLLQARGGVAAA